MAKRLSYAALSIPTNMRGTSKRSLWVILSGAIALGLWLAIGQMRFVGTNDDFTTVGATPTSKRGITENIAKDLPMVRSIEPDAAALPDMTVGALAAHVGEQRTRPESSPQTTLGIVRPPAVTEKEKSLRDSYELRRNVAKQNLEQELTTRTRNDVRTNEILRTYQRQLEDVGVDSQFVVECVDHICKVAIATDDPEMLTTLEELPETMKYFHISELSDDADRDRLKRTPHAVLYLLDQSGVESVTGGNPDGVFAPGSVARAADGSFSLPAADVTVMPAANRAPTQ